MTDQGVPGKQQQGPAPALSAMCAADLGLKAGFLNEADGSITFREIVGWATVPNYAETGKLPFVAVVLGDNGYPMLAAPPFFPDFVGVFDKGLSADKAVETFRQRPAVMVPSTQVRPIGTDRPVE